MLMQRSENDKFVREPMANWTNRELSNGFFDEDLSLAQRVAQLNSEGYEYRDDLYRDYRDKPSQRRKLDSIDRTPYGSIDNEPIVRVWRRADGTDYVEKGSWIKIPREGHHPAAPTASPPY